MEEIMIIGNADKRILVALDGSKRSFETIKYIAGVELFRKSDFRFTLFTVLNTMPQAYRDLGKDPQFAKSYSDVQRWELAQRKRLETFLEEARAALESSGIEGSRIECRLHNKQVGVARDIIKEAHQNYRAVMIGRKGSGLLKGVNLGSVATKLLTALTDIPVAIVGRDVPITGKVLLPLDLSDYGKRVADFAAANLAGRDYRVHLFHAIRSEDSLPDEVEEMLRKEVKVGLDAIGERLKKGGMPAGRITARIVTGRRSRAEAIIEEAKRESIGTIMMGRKGVHKIADFIIGRVSNKVVQMAAKHAVWIVS
jgi:nucleotide-binding universal stress UspA family protein